MNSKELDRLLTSIAAGDDVALETLYTATKKGVFSFLLTYLKQFDMAEDAMQTVYLKIKMHAGQYTPHTNAKAWILQIAKNTALTELKRGSRIASLTELDENDPSLAVHPTFATGSVTATMERVLTEEERRIVVLHVLWGYRHREIAEMYGMPVGTVTSKYKRAIAKLKKALKEEET